jgi:hypothetical protein
MAYLQRDSRVTSDAVLAAFAAMRAMAVG